MNIDEIDNKYKKIYQKAVDRYGDDHVLYTASLRRVERDRTHFKAIIAPEATQVVDISSSNVEYVYAPQVDFFYAYQAINLKNAFIPRAIKVNIQETNIEEINAPEVLTLNAARTPNLRKVCAPKVSYAVFHDSNVMDVTLGKLNIAYAQNAKNLLEKTTHRHITSPTLIGKDGHVGFYDFKSHCYIIGHFNGTKEDLVSEFQACSEKYKTDCTAFIQSVEKHPKMSKQELSFSLNSIFSRFLKLKP